MRVVRLFLAVLSMAAVSGEVRADTVDWAFVRSLYARAEPCRDLGRPSIANPEHISVPDRRALRLLDWMLRLDPARCPELAATAWQELDRIVGSPERPDVPVDYLHLAWRAAREGLGRQRDPALAERYARIAWLLDDQPRDMEVWGEAAPQRWLAHPGTTALLEARVAASQYHYRQARLLGEIMLRRDRGGYDPQRALALFSQGRDYLRQADLLSSGEHLPADYRRAGAVLLEHAYLGSDRTQRAMLQVGRRAGAAARTAQQHADALRMLFAASLDGIDDSCALLRAQLGRIEAPTVSLAAEDARLIAAAMDLEGGYGVDVASPAPIRMRALVDPTGRVVYAELLSSSGSLSRDVAARAAWVQYAERVKLSASTGGRLAWVALPPVVATRPLTPHTAPSARGLCQ